MAMSTLASRNNWDLICGVCQDIYRSPRFLPCHHSFCLLCIEGLARTHGRRFMCPQCRKTVQVPPEGPRSFPMNFYFKEEQLELARKGPSNIICSIHAKDMEPLVFFCRPCDKAICIRCKLTKHENHQAEDLSEAAEKCIKPLKESKLRLEKTIAVLSKKSQQAHEDLAATKLKSQGLKEQVKHQRDLLVARIDKEMKSVLEKVEETNVETEKQLETRASSIQKNLDSLTQLRQRVHHALEGDHADKVCAEREMREGTGNMQTMKAAIDSISDTTLRPVLRSQSNIADAVIRQYLGTPSTETIAGQISREIITPIVQLEKDNPCRRVHSVFFLDEHNMRASFGGMPPTYDDAVIYGIVQSKGCTTSTNHNNQVGKCSLQVYSGNKCFYSPYMSSDSLEILAKGRAMFEAIFLRQSGNCLISSITPKCEEDKVKTSPKTVVSISTGTMLAFDAQESGQKFALIDESKKSKRQKKRTVKLYSTRKKEPLATYQPPDEHFQPMDICFWHHEDDEKLLIADWHNDRIHVVDTRDNQLRFVRYLAEGNGHLATPTALNVDEKGCILIGCNSGWILRCEKVCPEEELDQPVEEESEPSVISELTVANGSQATEDEEPFWSHSTFLNSNITLH